MVGLGQWGDADIVAGRAEMYAEHIFKEEVFGNNASAYIAEFVAKSRERLSAFSRKAQAEYRGNERALTHLAGKVKYTLAHINLAECYGQQIGIMTEHQTFRRHALAYMGLVQAETEALEHFHFDG